MRRAAALALLTLTLGCTREPSSPGTSCDKDTSNTSYECLVQESKAISDRDGIKVAEQHVREWFHDQPSLAAAWCHAVMHELGHHWVNTNREVESVFDIPYSCAGGVLHGSFTAWAEIDGEIASLGSLCGSLAADNPPVMVWDCWHGVGHAVGVSIEDPSRASEGCPGIPGKWRESCMSGVYSAVGSRMGVAEHHGGAHKPLSPDPSWCKNTVGLAYSLCWERQGILSTRDSSFKCPAAGLGAGQCAYGVGRGQGQVLLPDGRWDRGWIERANNACSSSPVPSRCFDGVVYETVLHGEGRAIEDVCLLLEGDLGQCLLESGSRRSFEIQKPTQWILES